MEGFVLMPRGLRAGYWRFVEEVISCNPRAGTQNLFSQRVKTFVIVHPAQPRIEVTRRKQLSKSGRRERILADKIKQRAFLRAGTGEYQLLADASQFSNFLGECNVLKRTEAALFKRSNLFGV
ncbi:hypothetical protein AYM40_03010 [Paraburkholderia phytofirmans OLGA172]|uniref:Uncharacterized protein n=1 Tax=Paraburkholderia phytofirmans OLGA172 TaxID=1417228 RepID=A0A167VSK6_9BURK|nr:hypothetical protein AYM40_03010 [Paraburkholderia phytofirmans OLGA172]